MRFHFLKLAAPILLIEVSFAEDAIPTLRFPEGISWKGVFDAGFRPKHFPGLERKSCVASGQRFYFKVGETNPFFLDTERISFELVVDDRVRVFWHQEDNPITMKEGARRLDEFSKIIAGNLFQTGRLPPVVHAPTMQVEPDPRWNAIGRFGEYDVIYGFDASFNKERPLIPHFYLSWNSPELRNMPIRRHTVEPPEGYEWYSLDPKVDTPDPGSEASDDSEGEKDGLEAGDFRRSRHDESPSGSEAGDKQSSRPIGLMVALGLLLAAVGVVVRGKLRQGAP